jgi:hypothetical protein
MHAAIDINYHFSLWHAAAYFCRLFSQRLPGALVEIDLLCEDNEYLRTLQMRSTVTRSINTFMLVCNSADAFSVAPYGVWYLILTARFDENSQRILYQ